VTSGANEGTAAAAPSVSPRGVPGAPQANLRAPFRTVLFRRVRERPELLFLPFAAFWLLVNVAPWGFGPSYLYSFYQAFTLQKSNVIFPFTYGVAVASFVGVLILLIRRGGLGSGRAFLIAGTVPFPGLGAFEIIFQEAGRFLQSAIFVGYAQPYVMFSYGSWVVLGLTGVGWWRITWRTWLLLGTTALGWAVWFSLGFPLVSFGTFEQYPAAYALNLWLKAAMVLLFVLPIAEGALAGPRPDQILATPT
jgi:hypothetical protein